MTAGRFFGVRVRLHWSLFVILALIVLSLGRAVFPGWHPTWSRATCWLTAFAAAALFAVSVLVHELAHALTARVMRNRVGSVTLFPFGGVASTAEAPRSPAAELATSLTGPLVSLGLGLAATAGGFSLMGSGWFDPVAPPLELLLHEAGVVPTLLVWIGPVNLALAAFNLLPGFPLDGGRVVRAIFWSFTRDLAKATRWAALGGRVLGALIIALGAFYALNGAIGPGIWFMVFGWFLGHAARASLFQVLRSEPAVPDVPVARMMHTRFERVPPGLSVSELVHAFLLRSDQRAWPVELDGKLRGLVVWEDVRRVPESLWSRTSLAQIMTPRERLVTLHDDQGAETALDLMTGHDVDQLPVVNGDRLVGIVRRADLLRWFALRARPLEHGLAWRPQGG